MAADEVFPEPPDGAYALVGEPPVQVLLVRDDGWLAATDNPAGARWWLVDDPDTEPLTWAQVTEVRPDAVNDRLPRDLNRRVVQRLYAQAEVAAAVAAARTETVGEHRIESGGYCRHCGVHHSPEEIGRLRDREDTGG